MLRDYELWQGGYGAVLGVDLVGLMWVGGF